MLTASWYNIAYSYSESLFYASPAVLYSYRYLQQGKCVAKVTSPARTGGVMAYDLSYFHSALSPFHGNRDRTKNR